MLIEEQRLEGIQKGQPKPASLKEEHENSLHDNSLHDNSLHDYSTWICAKGAETLLI